MSNTALTVDHVCKVYHLYDKPSDRVLESLNLIKKKHKDLYVLDDISFTITQGEIVGIIGVNGAGKSTILKIITGVLNPTSGNVTVNGKISALLELGAGFNPDYTGTENIVLSGTLMGYTKEEIEEKIPHILEFADIGEYISQPVKTYSSGMFARLAFAVAINVDPDILIIDEALSVGDYFFQSKCYKKFEEFRQRGKTILFVSHDMGSILKYCNRAILLSKGHVAAMGETKDVIDVYKKLLVSKSPDNNSTNILTAKKDGSEAADDNNLRASMNVNPNFIEYGDKSAEIIDFGISTEEGGVSSFVHKFDEFSVFFTVRFHQSVTNPIFAFTIKDLKGTELFGTNTMIEDAVPVEAQAGDVYQVSFSQKMYLNGGNYLVSFGCTSYLNDNVVVHHRLYDICSVDVISQKTTVGFVDFDSSVEVIKMKG
jgi:teichoic acid transport system ATP-binding protein